MKAETKKKLELMGRIVTVTAEFAKEIKSHSYSNLETYGRDTFVKWVVKSIEPRAGWVVGFIPVYNGTFTYADDGAYFDTSGVVPAISVVYWPTMKPVKVPMDCYTLGGLPVSPSQRSYTQWSTANPDMAELFKQDLRNLDLPRDAKGRFIK